MNKLPILRSKRLCLAVTGLTPAEVNNLLPEFEAYYKELKQIHSRAQARTFGAGRRGRLKSPLDKILFILMFLKAYPTYDLMGFYFGCDGSTACRNVLFLLKVLEKTLKRNISLPVRRISTPEEFERIAPGITDVFFDGTERPVFKPRSIKKRNKLYSGKKKGTRRKSIVVSDEHKKIILLTPAKSGRRHDKKLSDKYDLSRILPPRVTLWTDTGFMGLNKTHPHTIMPKKRTKGNPLTLQDKEHNRLISSIRVVSEHAIAGMKRYKAASDIYRNRLPNLDDLLSLLSAGLWNYHILYRA
jgi:DDE superfamily endonuclease/Helix-turn-helix of DDE superfamily endonuclease